jgi:cellulose biosynthesis protein BcsQ
MAKIITFFNHKGGVGKTTIAYNVAWNLSDKGKKVLMIDADAQCNLTEISVDEQLIENESIEGYDKDFLLEHNIYTFLNQYVIPTINQKAIKPKFFQKKKNLSLLAGSLQMAELESTISLAISGVPALSQVPNAVYQALQSLDKDFDYIIIDLSPALSATNQLLLSLSDYFIVPVNPSIFSVQALQNLNQIFRRWNRELSNLKPFVNKTKIYPQMLGIVCQNYRPYSRTDEKRTKSAQRFNERFEELNAQAAALANDLNAFGMALTPSEYQEIFTNSKPYQIAHIPDYNQLATISETEKKPVVGLDDKLLDKYKINTPPYRQKVKDFQTECSHIVEGLLKLQNHR